MEIFNQTKIINYKPDFAIYVSQHYTFNKIVILTDHKLYRFAVER